MHRERGGGVFYEYFERQADGEYVEGSRLFVYKASRQSPPLDR